MAMLSVSFPMDNIYFILSATTLFPAGGVRYLEQHDSMFQHMCATFGSGL
jgi:hypothetical protein